jgi:hypothetical protein
LSAKEASRIRHGTKQSSLWRCPMLKPQSRPSAVSMSSTSSVSRPDGRGHCFTTPKGTTSCSFSRLGTLKEPPRGGLRR